MDIQVKRAKRLRGTLTVPGDKSISHRAILFGALARGTTRIAGLSIGADPISTLNCVRRLGVEVEHRNDQTFIVGKGLRSLQQPKQSLDCGNSGTTMRLLAGVLSGQAFESELVGDVSLSRRPMKRIIDPLRKMGAKIDGTTDFTAPLKISAVSTLQAIEYEMPVASAQVKSAIVLAGLYAQGTTRVIERDLTRDHTERMLNLTAQIRNGVRIVEIRGGTELEAREYVIPGDVSSATYLIAAALVIPRSEIRIQNVGLNPTRTAVLDILRSHGAKIVVEGQRVVGGEPIGDLIVQHSELKDSMKIEKSMIPALIDEIPVLAVTAALTGISFRLEHASELRAKESDRIRSMVINLRAMGLDVEEYPDGFSFERNKPLHGARIESYGDHRIAMAFGMAGLRIPEVTVAGAECVGISFPEFWEKLTAVSR